MNLCDHLPLADRQQAGRLLARDLEFLADAPGLIVLGLPRGGVVVAAEIARALHAPLDVLVVRKIGLPGQPEFAIGALASGGVQVLDMAAAAQVPPARLQSVIRSEMVELARRETAYREGRPAPLLRGRTVILADDGVATGATMEAAARAVRHQQARQVVVCAPVATIEAAQRLAPWVDATVFGALPRPFGAVGNWYASFGDTSDAEVLEALRSARLPQAETASAAARP
jgi:putative phosphoribosyl transferase